jgi:hypothetical protein
VTYNFYLFKLLFWIRWIIKYDIKSQYNDNNNLNTKIVIHRLPSQKQRDNKRKHYLIIFFWMAFKEFLYQLNGTVTLHQLLLYVVWTPTTKEIWMLQFRSNDDRLFARWHKMRDLHAWFMRHCHLNWRAC